MRAAFGIEEKLLEKAKALSRESGAFLSKFESSLLWRKYRS
jgi:hypothetical protein